MISQELLASFRHLMQIQLTGRKYLRFCSYGYYSSCCWELVPYMLFLLVHKSYSVQNELCSDESSQYWYSCMPVLMLQTGCLILLPKKGMKYPPPWTVGVFVLMLCFVAQGALQQTHWLMLLPRKGTKNLLHQKQTLNRECLTSSFSQNVNGFSGLADGEALTLWVL